MDRRPCRPRPLGDRDRVGRTVATGAQVVEVTVGDEHDVAHIDVGGRPRAVRVAEPRVDEEGPAAGRSKLEAGMAVPGEGRVAVDSHEHLPVGPS